MEKRTNENGILHHYVKSTLISVLAGELATMLLLLLFGFLTCKVDLPSIVTDALVILTGAVGALLAGFIDGRLIREKGMIFGAICGGILILIMFLFNVSFHELTSIPFLILKLAAILLCSILGGILGVNKKSRRMHP